MAYFLAVDGGGTKTSCLVGDEIQVLGRGSAAGSNVVRVGEERAREAIKRAIQQACESAQIQPGQIQRACVGMSGGAASEMAKTVQKIVQKAGVQQVQVVGDMVTALHAAFGSGAGVLVIAGTGSIAYGRNPQGATARAGGWGFAISDEGSAHWIGRTAVSAALQVRDEGANPSLLADLLRAWRLASTDELVIAANRPEAAFSALAPMVNQAAGSGDTLARQVLIHAGTELAGLASTVARKLFAPSDNVPVAMSGGVFANCSLVRETFNSSLHAGLPRANVEPDIAEPVLGALQLARQGTTESSSSRD